MISEYKRKENEAVKKFSPYILREFHPVTFNRFGFQTSINDINELWKFSDSQQEFRFNDNLSLLGGGLTSSEFSQLKFITRKVIDFTNQFGKPVTGRNAITRSLITMRALNALQKLPKFHGKNIKVLEIGPGSGYLGVLCRLNNIEYHATDITESLYLHQHYLWKFVLENDELIECLENSILDDKFCHIPWWTWADYQIKLPIYDVVIINHAVNEISVKGFKFILNRLKDSMNEAFLVVEGWGGGNYHENINTLINNAGARILHKVADTKDNYIPVSLLNFDSHKLKSINSYHNFFFELIIPHYRKFCPTTLKLIFNNFKNFNYEKKIYKFYSSNITSEFSKNMKYEPITVKTKEIEHFYKNLSSLTSLYTDDEKFGIFIGSTAHAS
jgi:hypothetical protein